MAMQADLNTSKLVALILVHNGRAVHGWVAHGPLECVGEGSRHLVIVDGLMDLGIH